MSDGVHRLVIFFDTTPSGIGGDLAAGGVLVKGLKRPPANREAI